MLDKFNNYHHPTQSQQQLTKQFKALPMKMPSPFNKNLTSLALAAMAAFTLSQNASAQVVTDVVNIDFGYGSGAPDFSGKVTSAAAGSYYNLIPVTAGNNTSLNTTLSNTGLSTSNSIATQAGFSIGNAVQTISAGYSGDTTFGGYLNGYALSLDGASYVAHHGGPSGGNSTTSTTFSITGLEAGTSGTIFFQTSDNNYVPPGSFTLTNGGTHVSYGSPEATGTPFINGSADTETPNSGGQNLHGNVYEITYTGAQNDGTITGTWAVGTYDPVYNGDPGEMGAQLSGLSIEGTFLDLSSVPEPSTVQFGLIGMGVLLFGAWRQRQARI